MKLRSRFFFKLLFVPCFIFLTANRTLTANPSSPTNEDTFYPWRSESYKNLNPDRPSLLPLLQGPVTTIAAIVSFQTPNGLRYFARGTTCQLWSTGAHPTLITSRQVGDRGELSIIEPLIEGTYTLRFLINGSEISREVMVPSKPGLVDLKEIALPIGDRT